jgi:hypothetical protein
MPAADDPMSLEAALDELYGVDPDEFVATRKRLAGELRSAADKDAVKAVQGARRPTTAAWALNRLSRDEPELVEELLERSRDLRRAQTGAGGRDAMREATRAQRQALADMVDAAMAQLGDRASDAYRSQLLATLQGASADDAVAEQLRTGRLVREVSGSTGFPEGPMLTLVPDLEPEAPPAAPAAPPVSRPKRAPVEKRPPPRASTDTKQPKSRGESSDARQDQARLAAARRLERDRERERAATESAQRRRAEADTAAQAAQVEAATAEAAVVEARERVVRLQHDLDAARREARAADEHAVRAKREAIRLAKAAARLRPRSPGPSS